MARISRSSATEDKKTQKKNISPWQDTVVGSHCNPNTTAAQSSFAQRQHKFNSSAYYQLRHKSTNARNAISALSMNGDAGIVSLSRRNAAHLGVSAWCFSPEYFIYGRHWLECFVPSPPALVGTRARRRRRCPFFSRKGYPRGSLQVATSAVAIKGKSKTKEGRKQIESLQTNAWRQLW